MIQTRQKRRAFKLPEETSIVIVVLSLIVLIGILRPSFLNIINLIRILGSTSYWGILALGIVFVLATGHIDISIGWMFNLSAVIAGKCMVSFGINPWIGALLAIVIGAILGMVNGLIAVGLNIPTIIVSLGTLSAYRGLSLVINQSRAVVPDADSSFFSVMGTRLFGGTVPIVAIIFLLLAIGLHFVLHRTPFGYHVQALGSNEEAARLVGMPIRTVRVQTTTLLGALAGLSGAMFLGVRGAIDPTTGQDFMLIVVAAAIIGGTPLTGGQGTVIGAFFGAFIIAIINSGIIFLGIDITWSTFVTGGVILLAVTIDSLVRRQRTKQE
jgi:ribose transport system permease protein